ncbi:cyclic AMP-responsive element-binding protein 3 protein 2, partial [Biomphalaria glabrata]
QEVNKTRVTQWVNKSHPVGQQESPSGSTRLPSTNTNGHRVEKKTKPKIQASRE